MDEKRNLGIITTKNCATKWSREYASTKTRSYTYNKVNRSSYHIKQRKANSIMAQKGMVLSYQT
jgi:hypothetical protein